jgi:hypothetical protein
MIQDYFSEDIKELLFLFDAHGVQYVIVGGDAVIYHGFARLTGDTDIYYGNDVDNVGRLFTSLRVFWDGEIPGLDHTNDLSTPGIIVQFGVPPNRIDLLNQIEGVSFSDAWTNRHKEHFTYKEGVVPVYFIGVEELIKNKENIRRPKDLDDLKYLYKLRRKNRT